MSNARIRAERRRAKSWNGPTVAPQTARRLAHLEALRTIAVEEKRIEERDAGRIIPVGGSGRRREKARRNARAVYDTELTRRVSRLREMSPTYAFTRRVIAECRSLEHDQDELDDLERRWENRAWAIIDPNVRVRDNQSYVGFEDVSRSVSAGEAIRVVEIEDGIQTEAVVTDVDIDRCLVYVAVDWDGWHDVDDETDAEVLKYLCAMDRQNMEIYRIMAEKEGTTLPDARRIVLAMKSLHGIDVDGFDNLADRVADVWRLIKTTVSDDAA